MKKHIRILSALMVLVLSLSLFCVSASAARAPLRYGDVYGDRKINILDATYVQRAVAQLYTIEENYLEAADVDSDFYITVIDATIIQQYVAQIIDEFPAGYSYHYDKELIGITADFMSGKGEVGTPITFTVNGYAHPDPSKTYFYIDGELLAIRTGSSPKYTYVFDEPGIYNIYATMENKWGFSAGYYNMTYEVVEKTDDIKLDIKNITYGPPHSVSPSFEVEVTNAVGECTFDFYIYERYPAGEEEVLVTQKLNTSENFITTSYKDFKMGTQYIFHVIVTDSEQHTAESEFPFMYNPLPIG